MVSVWYVAPLNISSGTLFAAYFKLPYDWLALFPTPTQFSVACSMIEQQEAGGGGLRKTGIWYLFLVKVDVHPPQVGVCMAMHRASMHIEPEQSSGHDEHTDIAH